MMKRFISLILSFVILISAVSVFPISVMAYEPYDGMKYNRNEYPYLQLTDDELGKYFVVDDGNWHSCIYNDDEQLTALIDDIKNAMYGRQTIYDAYFVVKDEYVKDNYINYLFDYICAAVYQDRTTPYGGDYLNMLTDSISLVSVSKCLDVAGSENDKYSFVRIGLEFEYTSTLVQEQKVQKFLEKWNNIYIQDNERINSSTGEERNYYIVKTIYNFLAKNTVYDQDLFLDTSHTRFPVDKERYKISHTAYGALMGNIEGSFDDEFDINTYYYEYTRDRQQLYRVHMMNQGRSVCDGYALVFYYLCKLNGIDCRIITGDYTDDSGKPSDPHAWNEVYLKDDLDNDYEWYIIDATFGSQCTQRIDDDYTYINYDFFLRGTENPNFSVSTHQQAYDYYDRSSLSPEDYRFSLKSVDIENARALVTRRRIEDVHVKYVADGIYNLENYAIMENDENGQHLWKLEKFKIVDDKQILVDALAPEEPGVEYVYRYANAHDSFMYYAANDGYWYSYEIYDYANGVEYICSDQKLKESGRHEFPVYDPVTGKITAIRELTISRLDMSDWNSYDKNLTEFTEAASFTGENIDIHAEVVDSSHTKLVEGRDYTMIAYKKNDSSMTPVIPKEPDSYVIRIDYMGNYSGYIEFPFDVKKINVSNYVDKLIEFQYGIDIQNTINLNFTTINGKKIDFEKGVDYDMVVIGGNNYLDEGEIMITALEGSRYLEPGTQKVWRYVINKRFDLTSIFAKNSVIKNERHQFTGNRIMPDKFDIYYTKSDGTRVDLIKDKDYKIVGYGENINSGKGTINIEFIGNYEGSAELQFAIEAPEVNKFKVDIPELTYNGKQQTPSTTVSYDGKKLVNGVDYVVIGSGTEPGIYKLTVQGINNYSSIKGVFSFIIKPSAVKSLKVTARTDSKLTLSWSAQGGLAAYQVYAYDSAKKKWCRIAQTTSNKVTLSAIYINGKKVALSDAYKYTFKVRAFISAKTNLGDVTRYSDFTSISTYTLPKAPVISKVTKSSKKLTLKPVWKRNTRASGYQVIIATNSSFTAGKKTATLKSNSKTEYTFKGLKRGKTYYIKVRAYKTVGGTTYYSSYSKPVKVKL